MNSNHLITLLTNYQHDVIKTTTTTFTQCFSRVCSIDLPELHRKYKPRCLTFDPGNLLLYTKFHQNRMIFRWDMAISGFSRWRISTISNFRGPIMGSLKPHVLLPIYRSPIETTALNCLLFEKIAFLCTHFGDRQTYRWTNRWTVSMRKDASSLSLNNYKSAHWMFRDDALYCTFYLLTYNKGVVSKSRQVA